MLQFLIIPQFNHRYNTVISADEQGFVEYWTPTEPFELPKNVPRLWSYKTETDLYDFRKVLLTTPSFEGRRTEYNRPVKIRADLHHPISRLIFLRDHFAPRSPDPYLQFPIREDHQEIRRVPHDDSSDAASGYHHLQSGRHGIWPTLGCREGIRIAWAGRKDSRDVDERHLGREWMFRHLPDLVGHQR